MAGRDLTYTIGVDASDAAAGLRKLESAVRSTMRTVEDELDEGATAGDKLASSLDRVAAQTKEDLNSAAIAAEELKRALKDAGTGLEVGDALSSLQRMGLSFDEITADADKLAVALKGLGDVRAEGVKELDSIAPGLASKLDDVSKSADSSKSVLANMIGNSAQDMGELAGITGSVGVAFGQMGEYMADALSGGDKLGDVFKNFAAVAGPIAGLALVMQTVNGVMQTNAARAEAAAKRTQEMGEAMEGAADDGVALAKSLRDSIESLEGFEATSLLGGTDSIINRLNDIGEAIPIISALNQDVSVNIPAAFRKASTSIYAFSDAVAGTTAEAQAFLDTLYAQQQAGVITGDEYRAITQALVEYRKSAADARENQDLLNVSADEANAILGELVTKADPMSQMADTWATLMGDMADGSIDTQAAADAINRLAAELGLTQEEVVALANEELAAQMEADAEAAAALAEGMSAVNEAFDGTAERAGALSRAFETFNADSDLAFSQMATNTVASFDDIKEALSAVQDIGSRPLVPTMAEDLRGLSDESAAVVDAIGGMRDAIQTELGAALRDSGGDFDALRGKATFFRDEVTAQFTAAFTEMGLGPAEVEGKVTELLGSLGLLPSQVETQIRLTQAEEAMRKIELFGAAIASLPADVQARVAAAVDAGDPVRAWNEINTAVQAQGAAVVPTTLDPTGAEEGARDFADAEHPTATVPLDADPSQADKEAQGVKTKAEALDPVVPIDSDTRAAINTMMYLRVLAALLAPVVRVEADIAPAMADLAHVASQRPRVPVTAYVADYPSASEIQAMIGRPRIPVDIVVGQTIRITGVRE